MIRLRVIVGAPGSGKTHRLMDLLEAELGRGVPPERLACFTFTRAARLEVLNRVRARFGFTAAQCPWFRTIHSAAFRLLECTRSQLMEEKRWHEFAALHGYVFTKVGPPSIDHVSDMPTVPRRTPDDLNRFVYDWGRNHGLPVERMAGACPIESVSRTAFERYVERYEGFRREHGIRDFIDLLEDALARDLAPDVDVISVDEAQDLSPLQTRLVDRWMRDCERAYVAGDDDQAVYQFQAGRADWFLGCTAKGETEVLALSHRVPAAVKVLADRIIRQNKRRVPKDCAPTSRGGEILRLTRDEAIRLLDGSRSTLVLARNRMFLRPYAMALLDRVVPFVVEGDGGPNPLGDERIIRALRAAEMLRTGGFENISAQSLDDLFRHLPGGSGLVSRDARFRVRAAIKSGFCYQLPGLLDGLGLGPLICALREQGTIAGLKAMPKRQSRYITTLLKEHGHIPVPRVTLTSVHAAKGREADLVVVIPDMTRATYDEYTRRGQDGREAENRVFYVAVTRPKQTLVLVEPSSRKHFDFPSTRASAATPPIASYSGSAGEASVVEA